MDGAGGIRWVRQVMYLGEARFTVYLQPQIDMATGVLTGAEALVRGVGEDGSIVPPSQFIPLLDLIIVLIMIAWYIADIALFFLGALILGLAGLIFRQAFNARLSFGQLFLLSIYAKTAALILKGVLNVFSIPVPFGTAMYMAISCGYLALAIKGISEEQERERQLSEMNASWKGGNPVWKPEGRDEDPDRNMNENSGE